jgi:tetratricopeptide (TPR) repeat protein
MTNSIFTAPTLAIALLAVMLLIAACDRQMAVRPTQAPALAGGFAVDPANAPRELFACDPPELKPIENPANAPAMLPVAYPGDELTAAARSDRPFAPIDPKLPLPPAPQTHAAAPAIRPPDIQPPSDAPRSGPPAPRMATAPQPPGALHSPPGDLDRLARKTHPVHTGGVAAPARTVIPPRPPLEAPSALRHAEAMRAVNRQAEQMIRRGYHLAERGALYSGRAEFIQALSTIAQALDLQAGGRDHTEALAAGLTALEEAEDFVTPASGLESDVDLTTLIRAHRTPLCKGTDITDLLPVAVLQQYYTYAQEQLARSAGGQEAASMAMLGLGKTYSTLAVEKSLPAAVAEPKAMVFHWAALTAHAGNFLAANELAVLEARWGQLATARSLLRYSLTILPHSAVWRNLATVHQRLGESKLAELAMRESEVAAKREADARPGNPDGIVPSSDVQWLDAETFASTSRSEIDPQKPIAANDSRAMAPAKPVVEPAPPRQRSAAAWFPWFR